MKKALILHGTDGSSQENWFPWLKSQLETAGYVVWCPDLPEAKTPNSAVYTTFILKNTSFVIDGDTILIGHSSGAVAILGLLQSLPTDTLVEACYLVGSFKDDLGWDALRSLFLKPFDFNLIRQKSRLWYFIHSDDDPYCPLEHAEFLHEQLGGDLIVLPGQKHFSTSTAGERYREFPYLLHLILGDVMTADDVQKIYSDMLERGVTLWLDGGWGVDALLGRQTRPHGDVDLVVQKKDAAELTQYLKRSGYTQIDRDDTSVSNFFMGNDCAQFVDVHVVELDAEGNGIYGPKENGITYPAEALSGKGTINGLSVRCISPAGVVRFHSGYTLRDKDILDVKAVCEAFGIEVPEEIAEYANP